MNTEDEKSRQERLDREERINNLLIGIAGRTVALLVLIILAAWLIGSVNGMPVVFTGVSFLFMPLVAGIIICYVASVVPLFLGGVAAEPISNSLYVLALFVFLAFTAQSDSMPQNIRQCAVPFLVFGAGVALSIMGASFSAAARVVTRAVLIVLIGYAIMSVPAILGIPDGQVMGQILFIGFIVAAVATLIGLFEKHSNEYLATAGQMFSQWKWPALIGVICALLLGYDRYLKPLLVSLLAGGVVVIEWAVIIATFAYVSYMIIRTVRWNSQFREHGDLHKLVQKLSYDRQSLEEASNAVEGFVNHGRKEKLIVYLALILFENEASEGTVEYVVSEIINYSDEQAPGLALRWTVGDVAGRNRKRRLAAVYSAISTAAGAVKYSSPLIQENTNGPK